MEELRTFAKIGVIYKFWENMGKLQYTSLALGCGVMDASVFRTDNRGRSNHSANYTRGLFVVLSIEWRRCGNQSVYWNSHVQSTGIIQYWCATQEKRHVEINIMTQLWYFRKYLWVKKAYLYTYMFTTCWCDYISMCLLDQLTFLWTGY